MNRNPRKLAAIALALTASATTLSTASIARADVGVGSLTSERTTGMVTADSLPTAQIDGVAWIVKNVGDTTYVGGEFTNARAAGAAPGTGLTPRKNFLAISRSTGQLIPGFVADANGSVKALAASPDGKTLYVGGSFTTIQGQTRTRLAAIDIATGLVKDGFSPVINSAVNAIVVTSRAVYIGGEFWNVNGVSRGHVAALSPETGALLGWNANTNEPVKTMIATPDQTHIIIGGTFATVNGVTQPGSASLDATTASLGQWEMNKTIGSSSGYRGGVYKLTTDGTNIIGVSFNFSTTPGFEGAFTANPTTGKLNWVADCHGDAYGATAMNGTVYIAGHPHDCWNQNGWGQMPDPENPKSTVYRRGLAFTSAAQGITQHNTVEPTKYIDLGGVPAPSQEAFWPNFNIGTYTGQSQGPWTVDASDGYVVYGGEFTTVNGVRQQGLARFATPDKAPRKVGPVGIMTASVTEKTPGVPVVEWTSMWDRDSLNLTYSIRRSDNPAKVIHSETLKSGFWALRKLSWTDPTPVAGASYTVVATDADGNASTPGKTAAVTTVPEVVTAVTPGMTVGSDGAMELTSRVITTADQGTAIMMRVSTNSAPYKLSCATGSYDLGYVDKGNAFHALPIDYSHAGCWDGDIHLPVVIPSAAVGSSIRMTARGTYLGAANPTGMIGTATSIPAPRPGDDDAAVNAARPFWVDSFNGVATKA